ncbi:branched-chain amino acid ABC transporter permease [Limnochorda pilosa]|uniref:Branched-chain amino acid ABC transporter permease n=1 Tax=Limnochorda pilosa TaxID=1555112 RepID=A0A0K2SJF3_LIMPI|nr:branched-chain amino acid ABC transporter permease [Limnochorda pilosa]BAS27215.1 branched-chain amino acid ABC transporter permease [Limnochorda pilosa]
MLFLLELAANGALVGLMYALVALGIVLVYKSSGVVNFAQGGLVMLGGYVVWALLALAGLPLLAAVPLALLLMAGLGLVVERVALRPMIGQPLIMVLMLTLGLEAMLRGLAPAVWGADLKSLPVPISDGPLIVADLFLNRVYLFGGALTLVLFGALVLFFRSRTGVAMKAVSDDHLASWAVGISVERMTGLSWALAGVLAVVAGLLWGRVQGVDWTLSHVLIKALAVAILGGLDSLEGAVVGGLVLGILEGVIPGYLDPLVGGGTREVVAAFVIFLTILVRPYGFRGREVIERV